jgi:hypothetical protein
MDGTSAEAAPVDGAQQSAVGGVPVQAGDVQRMPVAADVLERVAAGLVELPGGQQIRAGHPGLQVAPADGQIDKLR